MLESQLSKQSIQSIKAALPAKHYAIVMDHNTANALGYRISQAFGDRATTIMLDGTPRASQENIEHIRLASHHADALIAVGSGTINDLTKYASFLSAKPYGVCPTAPSMNGYSSANASLLQGTFKTTLPAQAPAAIWCDISVIANAPMRLIQSGLGDSLCRPTAQFDWLLSHLLLDTSYSSKPFTLLTPYESKLFTHAKLLLKRDENAITLLMKTLLASGDGMRMSGGSYPASQAEHMIAHTIEMMQPPSSTNHFHGEEIAVTTLTTARLQHEWIAQKEPPTCTVSPYPKEIMLRYFTVEQCDMFNQEYVTKLSAIKSSDIQHRLNHHWDDIRAQLTEVMMPLDALEDILRHARIKMTPASLNWGEHYDTAVKLAAYTRNRFTILDVI